VTDAGPRPAHYRLRAEVGGVTRSYALRAGENSVGSRAGNTIVLPVRGVSRRHALLTVAPEGLTLEDLGSRNGTLVKGVRIRRTRLQPGDEVRVGPVSLRLEEAQHEDLAIAGTGGDLPASGLPTGDATASRPDESGEIVETIDADAPVFHAREATTGDSGRRLALLCELSLQFGAEARVDALLQTIVDRLIEVIPGARRSALLVKDRATGRLLPKAWAPGGEPEVSLTSARQAMDQRQAFVWRRSADVTVSQTEYAITSGMYAPLLWKGNALGVVSVDNSEACDSFTGEDLRLMTAVAQQAAMAVANHHAQDELQRHAEFTNRFFASHFPRRAREKLLREASEGTLLVGTRQSPITVLISDIRGFAELTARLGARGTGDLLNEVFPRLVEVILDHDGTIERFAGDAIVAVFGSPEDDLQQHEKAVRAALAMQAAMGELNAARATRRKETCEIGIGIDCGEVLHGFIGDAERIQFAVIGDAANRASRYCDEAGAGEVLVSPEVHQRVFKLVQSKPTSIQAKHEGTLRAFRIEGIKR